MNIKYITTARTIAFLAIIFGVLTIKSGGQVLFIDGPARVAAGNFIPFVVWFNFFAGFVYIFSSIGLFLSKAWGFWLALIIAISTVITFLLVGLYISNDGMYETRTIAAMSLRSTVWIFITIYSYRKLISKR